MQKLLIIFFLFLTSVSGLFAQKFNASIDKLTVNQNERFQIYFTFSDGDVNKVTSFNPPNFQDLKILSGPNESKSIQIINGQVSGSLTFTFIAVAPNLGKVKIGVATISYENNELKTEPIELNVIQGGSTNSKVDPNLGISKEELNNNVFIRAIPNKTKLLQGEQLTLTYKLFTKLNIASPQISKLPTYNGFWTEDLETSQNIQFEIEMYNGERYRSAVIKKVALFPTKSGKLIITPFELKVPVVVKSKRSRNNIFDDFFNDSFFGRTETIEHIAKSNQLTISVDPLPNVNVPKSFNGAVGNFDFNLQFDKNEVDLNEAITVKARISGSGNIALIQLPEITFPNGIEKYEPKTSSKLTRNNLIGGRKDIEFLIVPRIPGQKQIDPIEFSYFDLSKSQYVTLKTEPFTLNVKEGVGGFVQNTSGYSKEDVKLLNEDIRFINTSQSKFVRIEEAKKISSLFWIGIFLPLGALLSLLIIQKRQDKISNNISLSNYQKAEKKAKKTLKEALKAREQNDLTGYYTNLSQALFGYLQNKLGLQKANFTLDKAIDKLIENNIDTEFIDKIKQTSEKCEFARFAPSAIGSDSNNEIFNNVEMIISKIQSSLKLNKKN